MEKVKAVFYLPKLDNNGRSLKTEIKELEMELTLRFAGWTCQGYVTGHYRMADGSSAKDVNASYFVIMEKARIDELKELLHGFIKKMQQEAIYLEIQKEVEFYLVLRD